MFEKMEFRYEIVEHGNNTEFLPAMFYETRFGVFGKALSSAVLRGKFRKTLAVIGQCMKEYYETGAPTTVERIKEIEKAR